MLVPRESSSRSLVDDASSSAGGVGGVLALDAGASLVGVMAAGVAGAGWADRCRSLFCDLRCLRPRFLDVFGVESFLWSLMTAARVDTICVSVSCGTMTMPGTPMAAA